METSRRPKGVATVTAGLLVVVFALAATTGYFAYRAAVVTGTGSTGSGGSSLLYSSGNAAEVSESSGQAADPIPNSITVSGAGDVSYIPNEALVSVSTVTENSSAVGATSSNAAVTSKVIKALNGVGVSSSSIETQGYNLNVDYSNCNGPVCIPQILGYTVTNNLLVNLTSTSASQLGSQAGNVIDTAVGAGANQVSLSFSETNSALATLTSSALQQALASASSQAKVIASSLGVSVTGVISASEGSNAAPQYCNACAGIAVAQLASVSTPIVPGSESFTISVQVVYAIT